MSEPEAERARHALRTGRVYDPPEAGCCRLLVDRLWPRGLTRAQAALDGWEKQAAPSTALRRWYGHDPARFAEFGARYRAELEGSAAAAALAEDCRRLLADRDVLLLTATRSLAQSGAAVLCGWLAGRLGGGQQGEEQKQRP